MSAHPFRSLRMLPLAGAAFTAACATAGTQMPASPAPSASAAAPSPDPRVGLKAGWFDAGKAAWNMQLLSETPNSKAFLNPSTPGDARLKNSDLAFNGKYVYQGNYSGYQVWDVSNPAKPVLKTAHVCPGSQSDVTVYKHLLFVSAEATSGRTDCGLQGVQDTVSTVRARGIRIYDISDVMKPKPVTIVQTCRGSHTNTLVTDPKDPANVYIYVSGSAGVRSPSELAGCSGRQPGDDPNSSLFRIEVIQVPLANPAAAKIVASPRIFDQLQAPPRRGAAPPAAANAAAPPRRPATGPTQCHDITTYPAIGLAGGACEGYGFLIDISDVKNPKRLSFAGDSNFSYWHSATFSNDGSKVLFSDEWGGGSAARCRATDRPEWGANAIFTIKDGRMDFQTYYKLPAAQTDQENCVAHNGSLIPVPGREIMVQSWYQGGISVFDWTDPKHPKEIAYFDRGPLDATKLTSAGHWSAYWYNGYIVGSEIARGLDILELTPSPLLSANEIAAAKSVVMDHFNPQEQPQFRWAPSLTLSHAYLDQLERTEGIPMARVRAARADLLAAGQLKGAKRREALEALATRLHTEARGAKDEPKAHVFASSVGDLAKATK